MLATDTCAVCGNPPKLFGHETCEIMDSVPMVRLRILDLFSGTGSSTQAFEDRGHEVITVELDPMHNPHIVADVTKLPAEYLLTEFGDFDFVWASPPCTAFSVASIGKHWAGDAHHKTPKSESARNAQETVRATLELIRRINPSLGFVMENPRGILRKLDVVAGLNRSTVTYCQYGDTRMKPTDLWGGIGRDKWLPSRKCNNGDACHVAAPRGSATGTQGIVGTVDRSRVPYRLSLELAVMAETAANEMARA